MPILSQVPILSEDLIRGTYPRCLSGAHILSKAPILRVHLIQDDHPVHLYPVHLSQVHIVSKVHPIWGHLSQVHITSSIMKGIHISKDDHKRSNTKSSSGSSTSYRIDSVGLNQVIMDGDTKLVSKMHGRSSPSAAAEKVSPGSKKASKPGRRSGDQRRSRSPSSRRPKDSISDLEALFRLYIKIF